MREGKIVDDFSIKDRSGSKRRVIFRFPKRGDLRAILKMVNGIRAEAEYLGQRRMETLKTERKWLLGQLKGMKEGKTVLIFVGVDGVLVGDVSIQPTVFDVSSHVGEFGIMLKEEFTGLGIGTRLTKKAFQVARKETGYKIISSSYSAPNKRSRMLHKKLGFRKVGLLPKSFKLRNGEYADRVLLYKVIK